MNIKLEKPLVFFDLETTGLSNKSDRIVEIAMKKLHPDGSETEYYSKVKPGVQIPKEASDIHGITNEIVENEPTFNEIKEDVKAFIDGCDLGGYNIQKFDVPFLFEEFLRNGILLNMREINLIDSYVIIRKMEKRDLSSLYKRYTGNDLENAHSAMADNDATIEIFKHQIKEYDLQGTVAEIHEQMFDDKGRVDMAGKFLLDDEKKSVVFNFGKYTGKSIREVWTEDPSYFEWIIEKSTMSTESKMYTKKFQQKLKAEPVKA